MPALRGGPKLSEIAVFSGSAHPSLAAEICADLEVPLLPSRLQRFANDCLEVQLQANCRERDVFLIQPIVPPVQEHLVELLLMLDAARGASASRITAVIPHHAYARSDKKDAPRISIAARLVADLLVASGANRILAMSLHSPQVHGFFSVPTDHLHALNELARHYKAHNLTNCVVVSPDLGYAKQAAAFARMIGASVAAGAKQRFEGDKVSISAIIGEIEGLNVIVLDDEIAKGSTVFELLARLRERGAKTIRVACTHGLFSGDALERLNQQPDVLEIACTNTVPISPEKYVPKLRVLSVAPALAQAMRCIHNGDSVSALFHAD
jgi:ribose-phosphate pyrophosphokinase